MGEKPSPSGEDFTKISVCPYGTKERNIHHLKAAVLNDLENYPRLKAGWYLRDARCRLQPVVVDYGVCTPFSVRVYMR
jgi:hypothetical protein